jgi:NOT2 / NOT3 / NOT5 family
MRPNLHGFDHVTERDHVLQDEAQLIAADELYGRGWWWHKKFGCWFIHAPNSQVRWIVYFAQCVTGQQNQCDSGVLQVTKGANGRSERGTYLFFDTSTWDVMTKTDVEISFDDVELPQRLPRRKEAFVR